MAANFVGMPMNLPHQIARALYLAFAMFWEILWALCLGFVISGIVQAVVSKRQVASVLGDERPKTIAVACGLGAASSSCSYAAVAIARSLFRKGASFTAAMAFELGSTNLVAELGIIMAILLGWHYFAVASHGPFWPMVDGPLKPQQLASAPVCFQS